MIYFRYSLLLFFCTLFISTHVFGQKSSRISGTIYEASRDVTIPGAHVFLNGTTLGAITNEDGTFTLQDVPPGVYQLIVKFLGFRDHISQVDTETLDGDLRIYLEESVYEMNEITVVSDRKEWQERFEIFRTYFLGSSTNAQDSKILNPEVLDFHLDPKTRTLTAEAYESLKIRNNALGYDIEFYLEQFSFSYKDGTYTYFGFPVFSEHESRRRRTNRKWKNNRKETYRGSYQHFIASLIDKNYDEEGFVIKGEMREERKTPVSKSKITLNVPDSSHTKIKSVGRTARYLSRDTVAVADIFFRNDENTYVLKFQHFLNVTYTKETEPYEYRKWTQGKFAEKDPMLQKHQNSLLTLSSDSLLIDKSGFIYNPMDNYLGGYWAFERFADLLPINYKPE